MEFTYVTGAQHFDVFILISLFCFEYGSIAGCTMALRLIAQNICLILCNNVFSEMMLCFDAQNPHRIVLQNIQI